MNWRRLTIHVFTAFEESYELENVIRWPKPAVSMSADRAILQLIARVLENAPSARLFQVSIDPQLAVNGKDAFELTNGSAPGSISISASSGVAAAWGFNYYLKYIARSSCKNPSLVSTLSLPACTQRLLTVSLVYWSGKNIRLSDTSLIPLSAPVRIVANDEFRWYGNPCTFSYSAVFWNFSR